MAIYKKLDVQGDVHPTLWKCFGYIAREIAKNGFHDIFITSIREGTHALTSFHYIGRAIDFKKGKITKGIIRLGIAKFCLKYGISENDFDLIAYNDSRDIFHLEYDPKNIK